MERARENELRGQGFRVLGVDEAGRGPLAGPVVAAACHIHPDCDAAVLRGVADSKTLDEEEREQMYDAMAAAPGITFAHSAVSAAEIDRVNVLQATMDAMHRCASACARRLGARRGEAAVLVDGNRLPWGHPEGVRQDGSVRAADPRRPTTVGHAESIVKGDARELCIAAASVVAKVTRDRLVRELDAEHPDYGLAQHKGYPTAAHVAAIRRLGPIAGVHRCAAPAPRIPGRGRAAHPVRSMTFAPIKTMAVETPRKRRAPQPSGLEAQPPTAPGPKKKPRAGARRQLRPRALSL